MSDFINEAQILSQLGYAVFQCSPKDKAPFAPTAPHGCNSAITDIAAVQKWWTQYPNCNIGIKCNNMLVFDLDCKDGIDGANDLRNIIQNIGKLPASPIARTGSGGWHLFFAKPDGDIIGQKKIKWQGQKTGIDIQTGNQYIVAAPSIHPSGKPYQWVRPLCPAGELPRLPAEWIERVLPKRGVRCERRGESNMIYSPLTTQPSSLLLDRCRAYIAAMPPAIQGQAGHSAILKVANVIFHGFGLSEAEGWQLMLEYNCRCCPPWDLSNPGDEKEFRRKIRQAIEKPPDNQPAGYLREQSAYSVSSGGADISAICSTQPNNITNDTANAVHPETLRDKERLPEHLQNVPGFVGKIVDFCAAYSPYPNKILALCGALSLMAFLTVRKVRAECGLCPNVYLIALAGSGSGKEYIRTVNKYILEMTGQCEYEGESIASGEGLEDDIIAYKKKLYQTDEIQSLFQAIAADKEARYRNAIAFLLKVYTSVQTYIPKRTKVESKKRTAVMCQQPGLVLFGTSTREACLDALKPQMIECGLGSRCIFIEGCDRGFYNKKVLDHTELPQEITDIAQWWTDFTPPNPKTGKVSNLYDEHPTPLVIKMTDGAAEVLDQLSFTADTNYQKEPDNTIRTIWTRVRENAIKLALLYACSRNYENPIIDKETACWASEFSYWVTLKTIDLVNEHTARSDFEKLCKRVLAIMRKRGGTISRTDLARATHLRPRELDEVVQALLIQDKIEVIFDSSSKKPKILYKMI